MEELPKIKPASVENKSESKVGKTEYQKNPQYQFVEKNFYNIKELDCINMEMEEMSGELRDDYGYLGIIDKKDIAARLFDFELGKKEILDNIIENLGTEVIDAVIPARNELIGIYRELEKKNREADGLKEEPISKRRRKIEDGKFIDLAKMISGRLLERESETQDMIIQDELKIKKIREAIAGSSKERNKKNVFDPQKEFLEISEMNNKSPEKREALARYKQKLKEQLIGVGEMNAFLKAEVFNGKHLNLNKLDAYIREHIKKYKLTPWQIGRYEVIFSRIYDVANIVDGFWNKNANKPVSKLLSQLVSPGLNLEGKIEVKKFPLALVFYFHSAKDFKLIDRKTEYNKEYDLDDVPLGKFIPYGKNHHVPMIIVDNSQHSSQEDLEMTFVHEYEHAVNNCIPYIADRINVGSVEIGNALKGELNDEFNGALNKCKDELLAFIKGGTELFDIYQYLTLDESYEYFMSEKKLEELGKQEESKEYAHDETLNEQNKFKTKYQKILMNSLVVMGVLKALGFDSQQAVGLVHAEKLENWPKVLKRITYDGELARKNTDSIRKEITFCDEEEKEIDKHLKRLNRPGIFKKLFRKKEEKEESKLGITMAEAELAFIRKSKEKLKKLLKQAEETQA